MNYTPIYDHIMESDMIILIPLDKYVKQRYGPEYSSGSPRFTSPEEYVRFVDGCRNIFYSDIVQRTTRVIAYINKCDENDDKGNALKQALCMHMRSPEFMQLLVKQLAYENNPYGNAIVGAFICEACRAYQEDMKKADEADAEMAKANKKKDDKATAPLKSHVDPEIVDMMFATAKNLLGPFVSYVQNKCIGMNDGHVLAVAALLAMSSENTVPALIESDIPVTADILNCPLITDQGMSHICTGVLRLQKADYVKLSVNQTKFVESLTKWIYARLNAIDPTECLKILTYAYGSANQPEFVKSCLIQPKDCGTQYQNLKTVAAAMKIN
jgi:hypothetical protein